MDTVFIEQLKIEAVIGIHAWERKAKQALIVDLDMHCDIREAAEKDDIHYALDYQSVSNRLSEYVGNSTFQLVETLAEKIATLVMNEFAVSGVRVKVAKPKAIENAKSVGVVIQRGDFGA